MVWYFAMAVAVVTWLVLLAGAWMADWDISAAVLPLLLCSVPIALLCRSRWVRGGRGAAGTQSAEAAAKGYPAWW